MEQTESLEITKHIQPTNFLTRELRIINEGNIHGAGKIGYLNVKE